MIRRIHGDAGIKLVIEEFYKDLKLLLSVSLTVKSYSLVFL
jgi:hypothetical protein